MHIHTAMKKKNVLFNFLIVDIHVFTFVHAK